MAVLKAQALPRGRTPRPLHIDVRFKLVLMGAASLVCLRAGFPGLGLLALAAASLFIQAGRAAAPSPGAVKAVGFLLCVVFFARALSADGAVLLSLGPLAVTGEGMREGVLVVLRLAMVFALGALFAATTRSLEIKAGLQWFLAPLPFLPAGRVAVMLGLLIRFLPMIFEHASATSDAQRARAVENRRNPVGRMAVFGLPFLRRVFETADRLALAMEARCYSDRRTDPELRAGAGDWAGFGAAAAVVLLAALL